LRESLNQPVVLKRHQRARRLRLRLDPVTGGAVLVIPKRASLREAQKFLDSNKEWIEQQQARLAPARGFAPGELFDLFGEKNVLRHDPQHRGRPLLANGELVAGGAPEFFARRVRDFLKEEARQRFEPLARTFATQLGVRLVRFSLREAVSRWGSCSVSGHISLNWKLVFAPHNVARYVVAHEVAHLREHNHAPAFWMLVNQLVGEYRTERVWLARHGSSLLRLGNKMSGSKK